MIEGLLAGALAVSFVANWYFYRMWRKAARRARWNRKMDMVVESASRMGLEQ